MSHEAGQTSIQGNPHARGTALLAAVGPYIQDSDELGLRRYLQRTWSLSDLTSMLNSPDPEVSRTAASCLGVLGGRAAILPLAGGLRHDDPTVVSASEDALWRLWFGAAGGAARRRLMTAVDLIEEGRYEAAIATLEHLIDREPDFAEAYHQRAITRYLQGDYVGSVADYKQAVRLNPCHFAALAGMGRAHADLGNVAEASAAYHETLQVHPRMDGVRQAMRKIFSADGRRDPVPCDD